MLGTFRYLLAILVTLSHLWTGMAGWSGVGAVFAFYLLSGYLMTNVLNQSYGFDTNGLKRYFLNRFLRIFPTYWVVLLFALAVVAWIPREAFLTNYKLSMPREISDWLPNIFIVGLLDGPVKVLIPPAWTLDIEIFFYVLMGLGLSRNRVTVTAWFGASAAYTLYLVYIGAEFVDRYAAYGASSLPFSMGAMVYMYREWITRYLRLNWKYALIAFVSVLVIARKEWLGSPLGPGFYLTLAASFCLLVSLIRIEKNNCPNSIRKIDQLLAIWHTPYFYATGR